MDGLKSLGWMNGWKQDGPEYKAVQECRDKKHKPKEVSGRSCVSVVTCTECKHEYRIDSSG